MLSTRAKLPNPLLSSTHRAECSISSVLCDYVPFLVHIGVYLIFYLFIFYILLYIWNKKEVLVTNMLYILTKTLSCWPPIELFSLNNWIVYLSFFNQHSLSAYYVVGTMFCFGDSEVTWGLLCCCYVVHSWRWIEPFDNPPLRENTIAKLKVPQLRFIGHYDKTNLSPSVKLHVLLLIISHPTQESLLVI